MKKAEGNDGNAVLGRIGILAVVLTVVALTSGCSVLDSIDRQLVSWGVVDGIDAPGFDELAVVQVDAGSRKGVGVVLEGGMIFTANHVVRSRSRVIVRTFGYYRDGYYQTLEARVVYRNRSADQALLTVLDAGELDHTAELASPRTGSASVLPLRPAGRSSFGYTVNKPVVRFVTVAKSGSRFKGNARLAKGDSGAPVVQDGKVVGLVQGASRMIAPDVMAGYEKLLRSRERRSMGSEGSDDAFMTAPECSNTRAASRKS
jgi:S1-C subfamily serine protease